MKRVLLSGLLLASLLGCRAQTTTRKTATTKRHARAAVVTALSPRIGGGIALADVGGRRTAVVADAEERALVVIDVASRSVVSRVAFADALGQIAVATDGAVYAAVRGAHRVVKLRFGWERTLTEIASQDTGDEPFGLALSPDEENVYVTSIVDERFETFAADDLAPRAQVTLPHDPRSIVVDEDGKHAFVSHATGSVMSIVDLEAKTARTLSLSARERRRDFGEKRIMKPPAPDPFGDGRPFDPPPVKITLARAATQGFALAMIGGDVFAPETLVMTGDLVVSSGYGSTESTTLSTHVPFVARVHGGALANPELSGPDDRRCFEQKPSCILPRGVATRGDTMYVACLDSNEVVAIDTKADYEHAPSCVKAFEERKRIEVVAPSAVAVHGDDVVIFSEETRRVTFAADGSYLELPRRAPASELVVAGRALFHRSGDARISKNGRACASCHVDGRDDALVWPTPKGKRQTPMLAGRLVGTAPYDWNGAHASLPVHIRATLQNLEGKGLGDHDLDALAAYLTSLPGPPKRAKRADRGAEIFASAETQCSTCHVESMRFADGSSHALFPRNDEKHVLPPERFDTPSLAFVGQTPPYFHDGRWKTLDDLVEGCDGVMGHTKHLSSSDKKALVAYLRTL